MIDPRYVLIDRGDIDFIVTALSRAHTRCANARTIDYGNPEEDKDLSYPAASGYAMGTMQYITNMLVEAIQRSDDDVTRLIDDSAVTHCY